MQKLDLHDVIKLEVYSGDGVEFFCEDETVPSDETNLAVKAAHSFLLASARSPGYGVRLSLKKHIPVAAGLGGGSSDAGTVLRGLNDFFGHEFTESQLIDMARSLGADIPFFAVEHDAVFAAGIGDIMYPVDSITNCSFILVNPDFFVSTAWVFQNFTLTRPTKNSKLSCFQKRKTSCLSLEDMHNDLEQVTSAEHQEIDRIKMSLLEAGASKVMMSGSGPTVFGVFPDNEKLLGSDLKRIVGDLSQEYGEKVFLSRACTGAWPSGKAPGFDPGIRRFESCRPSHH